MRQPSKEKVEQYRREFSEVLKDFMAQTIGKMLQAELDDFLRWLQRDTWLLEEDISNR